MLVVQIDFLLHLLPADVHLAESVRAEQRRPRISGLFGWHLFTWIPEQYQNLNSIWIVLLSPVLVFIYNSLGRIGKDPAIAAKFAWGFAAVAIGFFIYGVGARWAVERPGVVVDHGVGLRACIRWASCWSAASAWR